MLTFTIPEVWYWVVFGIFVFAVFTAIVSLANAITYWKQWKDQVAWNEELQQLMLAETAARKAAEQRERGLSEYFLRATGPHSLGELVRTPTSEFELPAPTPSARPEQVPLYDTAALTEMEPERTAAIARSRAAHPSAGEQRPVPVLPPPVAVPVATNVVAEVVPLPVRGKLSEDQVRTAIKTHERWGVSWEELARGLGVSATTLRRYASAVARTESDE